MENRFGVRDLILTVLLLALIGSVWLSMKQADRHKVQLDQIQAIVSEQTKDLTRIQNQLAQGVVSVGATATQPSATTVERDPFEHVRAAQKQPGYAKGDYFVDVFSVVPDKLTPIISSDAYSSMVQGQVLENLCDRDERTLDWKPVLATAWRISPDGLRIEFDLRQNVLYSDGEPMTADDFVWTFNWIMNPEVEAPRHRSYFEKVAKVEKLSDKTIAFIFKEPYFDSFSLAASFSPLPKHFYSSKSPSEFNRSTGLLLGTGPYRMPDPESWKPEPGKPITLYRNDRYWGQPAPFDRWIFNVIDNEQARLTTFENRDIDAIYPTAEQYTWMLEKKDLLKRTQHFEYDSPTAGYAYVAWNQKREGKPTIFADKRVRQAMTMLIDRDRVVQDVLLGYATVPTGPFNPLGKQCDPSIKPWPYDPARAKELLKQAGYEDRDNDGVLESPSKQPLKFKLTYPAKSETYKRVVLFMKDTMAKAGVVLEPDPAEWSVLIGRLEKREFDSVSLGWTAGLEGDLYQIFHSSQIEGTGDNAISYSNPELDKAIEAARSTVDEATRMPIWRKAHQIMHDDQPYTFMFIRKSLSFIDGRFRNVQRTKLGLNPQMEWWVPAELRRWSKSNTSANTP